jgi:hypothetical protein
MTAIEDIAAERKRQIEAEGWTVAHDDEHHRGEIARAASVYAYCGSVETGRDSILANPVSGTDFIDRLWPWDWKWFKPKDRRQDLVRAGALIVAEIERLDRSELRASKPAA